MFSKNEKLMALVRPKTKQEASYKVYAIETQYPNSSKIYIPKNPIEKLLPGMEAIKKLKKNRNNTATEDDIDRSLRRSKKIIADLVLCNMFELWATFTFNTDRQDIEKCRIKMRNWLKNQQKRTGRFGYLIVPEYHKDNESLHFHALLKGYKGKLREAVNPKTGQKVLKRGKQIYTIPGYRLGFTSVEKIDNNPESHNKVSSYVRKYLLKDMPLFAGKHRYWASQQLKTPKIIENPPAWYENETPASKYAHDYGLILFYLNRKQTEDAL